MNISYIGTTYRVFAEAESLGLLSALGTFDALAARKAA